MRIEAEEGKEKNELIIGTINAPANEIDGLKLRGFPSVRLYLQDGSMVEYSKSKHGPINYDNLWKFMTNSPVFLKSTQTFVPSQEDLTNFDEVVVSFDIEEEQ